MHSKLLPTFTRLLRTVRSLIRAQQGFKLIFIDFPSVYSTDLASTSLDNLSLWDRYATAEKGLRNGERLGEAWLGYAKGIR